MGLNLHHDGVFCAMEHSQFEFHLTGSRYFGTQHADSDWDFFVESHADLYEWLEANGFQMESGSDYTCDDISEVWKHESEQIHVQVINDADRKVAVQSALRCYGRALYRTPKADRKTIWNLAFRLFDTGKREGARYQKW